MKFTPQVKYLIYPKSPNFLSIPLKTIQPPYYYLTQ